MDILKTISQELNQIARQVDLAIEPVVKLPFAEDEDCFQQVYKESSKDSLYWIPWTEQIGAWVDPLGSQVSLAIREDALDTDPKQLMWGFASVITGVCLNLQGKVAIHANAVAVEGRTCAFAGYSGMGKSTLTAYCASRGAGFITDDVLVVDEEGLVTPGSPRLKLYPHTGESLGLDISETADNSKVFYDVKRLGAKFNKSPTPLSVVYLLAETSENRIYSERLSPSKGVFGLLTHSYYASELIEDNPRIFETYINLVANVPVKTLFYPRDFQKLSQVYDFLVREARQL